jgi:hypothetical protein
MSGLSRSQVARLIRRHQQSGPAQPRPYRRHRFAQRYTAADIEQLAQVDEAHQTLSGPATQKILQRELHEFDDERYERQRRVWYQPTQVAIGERRKQIRRAGRATRAWTPCTKATATE